MAYITTGYPYVSHTFIQNEVASLRRLGVEIKTFAMRREPREQCRTAADLEAWNTTYTLRPPILRDYVSAHVAAIRSDRRRYFAALRATARRGWSSPSAVARHLAYFVQATVLWDRCRRDRIGHIHAHFANVASDVAMIASTIGTERRSWSFTMHGPTEFADVRHFQLAEKVRAADFIICISEFARSQLMALVPAENWDKLEVVHCGVDRDQFDITSPIGPCDRLDDPESLRITCVGRLVPEKGQRVLVEAVGDLRLDGIDARLCLVGDGPERVGLERLVCDRDLGSSVSFLGSLAHTAISPLLAATDVFCLPSFAEGVPIVLMEAMASGIAVVASKVMGIPELIEDGISGRLTTPGSRADLTHVLAGLARDPAARSALGVAGRAQVLAEFDLEVNARRLLSVYDARIPA